MSNVKIHNFYQ